MADPETTAPDAVMASMETETDPLPDAVAAAWDVELNPPDDYPECVCGTVWSGGRMCFAAVHRDGPRATRIGPS